MTAALVYLCEIADTFFASHLRRAAIKIERHHQMFSRHGRLFQPSRAKLGGQVVEIFCRNIDRNTGRRFTGARAILVCPREMRSTQSEFSGGLEVVAVRGNHHAFMRVKIERLGSGKIDARLGLVVAGELRAKNGVPRNTVAPGKIDHQRNVAV